MRLLPLAALLPFLLLGCSTSSAPEQNLGYIAGSGIFELLPADEREPAPAVRGETLTGEELALADLDGPVVVNFWASWCGPCVREAPALTAVAEAYEGRASVVGVNIKDRRANALAFEERAALAYPSWYDEPAAIAAAFGGIGPAALPSTIVLDADHRVAVRLFGEVSEPQLVNYLDHLLEEEAA